MEEKDKLFEGFETSEDFVKVEAGIAKIVVLTNPRKENQTLLEDDGETTKIVPGLVFDVKEEDGKEVKKKMTITSKRLVKALKPFIENGQISENLGLKVKIFKTGEKFNTKYTVEAV